VTSILFLNHSFANERFICDKIARQVEVERELPQNILTSISLVEAGRRYDDGKVSAWPWSLNHAGKSLFFDTKLKAEEYLKGNINNTFKNIDVGCMQINVRWHREHFDSFEVMLDPKQNIEYAATFLTDLKQVHGSWKDAIKHYHSSTAKLNVKYYAKVQKVWNETTGKNTAVQKASLFLEENIIYPALDTFGQTEFQNLSKKNLDDNSKQMLKFEAAVRSNNQNEVYLNAVLIENKVVGDREELQSYLKYKSAYLGNKIDMILLF
jgi:hypothetical protein